MLLCCPSCRGRLEPSGRVDELRCPRCGDAYGREAGIWRLLAPGRAEALRPFVERYEAVRAGEGRGVASRRDLEALPFRDRTGKRRDEWRIRARSFRALLRRVVRPHERRLGRPLAVLDLGSGVGWLARRLVLRGHDVAAVDIATSDGDGLGAQRLYERPALLLEAEFDRLPLADRSVDLVVYNASIHYAADCAATLREGLRVLREGGLLVLMDSPLYRDRASGLAMVRERESRLGGALPDAPPQEGFLTHARLGELARELGLAWESVTPWYGVRWWLRPWLAKLRGGREPAAFKLVIGRRAHRSGAP